MSVINNVDAALTSESEPDLWAERDERTEDTTPSELTWGRPSDAYYAGAHAVGAALRALRRRSRTRPAERPTQSKELPPRYGRCECGRLVVGWHAGCTGTVSVDAGAEEQISAYHERLSSFVRTVSRITRQVPAEWRTPPGYPNYLLHSRTRELWRKAYEITIPNGTIRRYPAKAQKPQNGSYSLTVNGKTSSRGIEALWRLTFPEYAGKKKKKTGEWAAEVKPHRAETSYYRGLAEWLGEGGAGIVTRP